MRAWEFIKEGINPDILHPEFKHEQEINGYIYKAEIELVPYSNVYFLRITANVQQQLGSWNRIGYIEFTIPADTENGSLVSDMVWVDKKYRKEGIASTMYAYARMLGNTIKPSSIQLPPGKKMWQAWEKSGDAEHLMKEEVLDEAATAEVYHSTSAFAANRILKDQVFRLSSVTGNSVEEKLAPPGYPYFFSTTRSKVGDYHRYVGNSQVMFVIDGNWLNRNHKTKPVDYWERMWDYPGSTRSRESEDRVFSKTPELSIDCVTAIHVLIKEQDENRSPQIRSILLNAKKQGITTYLYTDENAWRLQDTRHTVSPSEAKSLLSGPQPKGYTSRGSNFLEPWLELIYKTKKQELTPKAERKRYDLVYYGIRNLKDDSGLGTDMSNARKPESADYPSAVKINQFMQKNKLASTLELKNWLAQKWEKIK